MYIARIKINWGEANENEYYEKNKWYEIFQFKDKKCFWRIKEKGVMEFILGYYNERKEALEDGKMLYFNILYDLHRNEHCFELGDNSYITQMYHEDRRYTVEEYIENEEWFYVTKKFRSNFYGLSVFEVDEDISDYDKYYKNYEINIKAMNNEPFLFLYRISDLNCNYKYSKKNQEIFNLIKISEQLEEKTKILLLCQALELMGEDLYKSEKEIKIIDELISNVDNSDLDESLKDSLKGYLENGKKISSRKKCENLINKYCSFSYKDFDKIKLFKKAYKYRSSVIHGDVIKDDDLFITCYYLKCVVLDVLKEWTKDN